MSMLYLIILRQIGSRVIVLINKLYLSTFFIDTPFDRCVDECMSLGRKSEKVLQRHVCCEYLYKKVLNDPGRILAYLVHFC